MKSKIIKFISLFSILFTILFSFTFISQAASSTYNVAFRFTFTSDMNIEEGFSKIKPYLLLKNGIPSSENFEFNYTNTSGNSYNFKGTYPDGKTFSYIMGIKIIDSKYGSYVEAQEDDINYQVLIATKLNENSTLNDCLNEAWTSHWHNIKYPEYKAPDTGTTSYLESDCIAGNGTAFTLKYQAKIDSTNNNPNQGSTTNPSETNPGGSTTNPNPEGSGNGQTNSNNNKKLDPVMIVLITISSIFGLILLFYIYKLIRMLIRWFQRK